MRNICRLFAFACVLIGASPGSAGAGEGHLPGSPETLHVAFNEVARALGNAQRLRPGECSQDAARLCKYLIGGRHLVSAASVAGSFDQLRSVILYIGTGGRPGDVAAVMTVLVAMYSRNAEAGERTALLDSIRRLLETRNRDKTFDLGNTRFSIMGDPDLFSVFAVSAKP